MPDQPDQFTFHGVNYTLLGRYKLLTFICKFLDGEFPDTCTYLIQLPGRKNPKPSHRGAVLRNLEQTFLSLCLDDVIAVYERMSPLQIPEMCCGNCHNFYRHYSGSDLTLNLAPLREGHCTRKGRIFNRAFDDKPANKDCFEWNDECKEVISRIRHLKRNQQ